MISKQEYQAQAAQGYNRIPLVQELLADLDTPLSLYLKLANRPYTYLLESVVGGERFGRYSFIGLPCSHYLKASGKHVDVYQNGEIVEQHDGNPLPFIEAFHNRFKNARNPKSAALYRRIGRLLRLRNHLQFRTLRPPPEKHRQSQPARHARHLADAVARVGGYRQFER